MYNFRKEKEKSYKMKIENLHKEMENVNSLLSSKLSEIEHKNEKIKVLDKEIKEKSEKLKRISLELDKLNDNINSKDILFHELVKNCNEQVDKMEEKKKKISSDIIDLELINNNLDVFISDKKLELSKLKNEISKDENRLIDIGSKINIKNKELEKVIENIGNYDLKKQELLQLMEKNGKIFTDTEKSLGKLNVYARRVQKFCNEKGIKMNLVKELNLE